ncbi:MAG TPA: CopD family protein [Candidatus Limnocylindrales bacterium]|nr:CopD family protein [Candidatus Limnocylindrales bacterium]
MQAFASLIPWPQPVLEFLGFIAAFLATGAIGFRFIVIRPWIRGHARTTPGDFRNVALEAARRAATIGLLATALALALFVLDVHAQATERHLPFEQVFGAGAATPLEAGLYLLAIIGFGLAIVGVGPGWHLAAAGVILGALRPIFFGQWARLINPIHMLAGGMWLGTLFHVVVAGIWLTLRSGLSSERRGFFVREIVARFSPFALASAGVLATFGVITAWRHLKTISALWTTPYGLTLIVKLCVVAAVLALGAFNLRRQRPLLGSEAGARALRRSASAELLVAMIVLVITSVLVSLPSPKPPPQRPSPRAAAGLPPTTR